MGSPSLAPIPPSTASAGQGRTWYDPQRHGTWAQWVVPIAAALLGTYVGAHFVANNRAADSQRVTTDEHTNTLIAAKLDPAVEKINESINAKFESVNQRLDELSKNVAEAQGELRRLKVDVVEQNRQQQELKANVEEQGKQQQRLLALNKLQDPNRVLGVIRAELRMAETNKQTLPETQLAEYKNAVLGLAPASPLYWQTVAAIINYQSLVNEMSGAAPDPTKVSGPCDVFTEGKSNTTIGGTYRNCIVDLDSQAFTGLTFINSVIRYRGGDTYLTNVRFINCRFILDLPPTPQKAPEEKLLLALLESPDQRRVRVN